jgi:NADPH-dependent 2,4-dienoyl-CoA reductase/sulfur reductase-like enzyme
MGRRRVLAVVRETGQEKEFHFDRLVIATGANAEFRMQNAECRTAFNANTLSGAMALHQFLAAGQARKAVVLGGGYIGIEMAEAMRARGLEVAVVEREAQIMEGFDAEITSRVEAAMAAQGVLLYKGSPALAVKDGEVLSEAGRHPADVVILATGMRPNVELAESAGVALGRTGAIAVDDRMQTNLSGVYAAGDCAETTHLVTGRQAWIPLGTTANKQGRVAGENACGGNARFPGVVGTMVTKVFGLECARTGLSEAEASSYRVASAAVEHVTRAAYMAGEKILVKLLAERGSGRLLGAQMAAAEGAAKRIDVLATALHARMTVDQVSQLDLSYAPPVAPVWEAVLLAAQDLLKQI